MVIKWWLMLYYSKLPGWDFKIHTGNHASLRLAEALAPGGTPHLCITVSGCTESTEQSTISGNSWSSLGEVSSVHPSPWMQQWQETSAAAQSSGGRSLLPASNGPRIAAADPWCGGLKSDIRKILLNQYRCHNYRVLQSSRTIHRDYINDDFKSTI